MSFAYPVRINETDLDVFGHVNNATYLRLFEEARWALMNHHGYPIEKVLAEQKGPIILEVHLKFMRELKARDQIEITFEVIERQKKITKGLQKMIFKNGDRAGQVACELVFTSAFFDMIHRKIIEPNEAWLRVLG